MRMLFQCRDTPGVLRPLIWHMLAICLCGSVIVGPPIKKGACDMLSDRRSVRAHRRELVLERITAAPLDEPSVSAILGGSPQLPVPPLVPLCETLELVAGNSCLSGPPLQNQADHRCAPRQIQRDCALDGSPRLPY